MDGTEIINVVERGIFFVLGLVALGLEIWAFIDCIGRKAPAFDAMGKKTKGFWLALTGGATAIGLISLSGSGGGLFGSLGLFGLAAVVAASVYLADVRPAVREAGRGGNRNSGPYGGW